MTAKRAKPSATKKSTKKSTTSKIKKLIKTARKTVSKAVKKIVKKTAAPKAPPQKNAFSSRLIPKRKTAEESLPLPTLQEEDAVASEIVRRLRDALAPSRISIQNLTKAHAGHQKDPGGHYVLSVVSELFNGLNRMQRERWVSSLLADLMSSKIHALSLKLKSPEEDPKSLL